MNNSHKSRKRFLKLLLGNLNGMSRHSMRLLHICLPLILLELIALFILFRDALTVSPVIALHNYPSMFEYIMVSIVLSVGAAVILDISEKKDKK